MKGTMTTAELARSLGVRKETIRNVAKRVLNKQFRERETGRFTEQEVSLIIDTLKNGEKRNLSSEAFETLQKTTTAFDSTINLAKAIKYLRRVDTELTPKQSKELIAWALTKSDYNDPYIKQLNSFHMLLDTKEKAKELSEEFERKVSAVFEEVYGTLLDRIG